jgi:hypothetical protein
MYYPVGKQYRMKTIPPKWRFMQQTPGLVYRWREGLDCVVISGLENPDTDVDPHVGYHADCLEDQVQPVELGGKVADLRGCLISGAPVEVEWLTAR